MMIKPRIELISGFLAAKCAGCGKRMVDHPIIDGEFVNFILDGLDLYHPLCFNGDWPDTLIAEYTAESARSTLH